MEKCKKKIPKQSVENDTTGSGTPEYGEGCSMPTAYIEVRRHLASKLAHGRESKMFRKLRLRDLDAGLQEIEGKNRKRFGN